MIAAGMENAFAVLVPRAFSVFNEFWGLSELQHLQFFARKKNESWPPRGAASAKGPSFGPVASFRDFPGVGDCHNENNGRRVSDTE